MAHYCRGCGRHDANEAFSGKGHKRHICKKCVCKQRAERKKREAEETRTMEAADLQVTGGRYFCDDGTEFNPDLRPTPDLCVSCKKTVGPVDYEETILCNLTRGRSIQRRDIHLLRLRTQFSGNRRRSCIARSMRVGRD